MMMQSIKRMFGFERTPELNSKILVEQAKMLYESITSLVLINLIVSTALVCVFWNLVSHAWLLAWMVAMLLMLGVRIYVYHLFKRRFDYGKVMQYRTFLILGSTCAGIIWGVGGLIMFLPDSLEYQLLILLSLLGMASGSAFSLSIYLPAYFAFVPLMLVPIAARLFIVGDTTHIALASVTLIFLIAQSLFNIKINGSLSSTIALRFENLALIDQLQEQKGEAERANNAKTRFLAAASHDLRQPLYALLLFTHALEERDIADDQREITQQIKRSTQALESLFEALLDISKLDAGTVNTQKSDISLQGILEKLGDEFDLQAAERNLTLQWPQHAPAVCSDPVLLEQILRNYLTNAIRYTQEGGVSVTCEPQHDRIKISVTDTGLGMPLEDQNIIFEEFYQRENPERDRHQGLGLGLSIVQRAASQLGHELELNSQLGCGSTFSVIVDAASGKVVKPIDVAPPMTIPPLPAQPLVVVVDDEESIREGMQQLLSLWDCQAVICASDEEAIALLRTKQRIPDGIICDFRLRKGRTGLEAINAINIACKADIPALIVTGDTEKSLLQELKSSGYQVLHKPVPPAKLRAFLRSLPGKGGADIDEHQQALN
jgi:signal transduction histidine kinase/CheY-like chemotaxis protein